MAFSRRVSYQKVYKILIISVRKEIVIQKNNYFLFQFSVFDHALPSQPIKRCWVNVNLIHSSESPSLPIVCYSPSLGLSIHLNIFPLVLERGNRGWPECELGGKDGEFNDFQIKQKKVSSFRVVNRHFKNSHISVTRIWDIIYWKVDIGFI